MFPDTGDRPFERAGGNARSHVHQAFQGEGPRCASETAGPARDGRDFDKRGDVRIRGGSALTGKDREDAVAIGRDEANCSYAYAGYEVDLGLESHGKPTKMRGMSRPIPGRKQSRELDLVDLSCCQGTFEG